MSDDHSTTPGNEVNLRGQDTLRQLLMQDYALGQLYAIHKELKADVAAKFESGEKTEIVNDQGVKLGSVSMSQPNKKAVPDDDSVLLGYATAHGYELEDTLPAPGTKEYNAIIDLVYSAGREDELLGVGVSKDSADAAAKRVLEDWQITGELEPGWTIKDASQPKFTLTKGRTAQAKAALEHFTAPVRDALNIPTFKAIEEGK